MAVRVGINGFGRIGRLTLRAILEQYPNEIEVVALNDIVDAQTNAHLFKYDSSYGIFSGEVGYEEKDIIVNGKKVYVYAERDPANIPWGEHDVQIVVESTGIFREGSQVKVHLRDGVKKAIITAPAKNEDVTIVLGVNEEMYDPARHAIISNASCTTNCLGPVAKVLQDNFGIARAFMTTVHAYTNDQKVQDQAHKDLRRARAAGPEHHSYDNRRREGDRAGRTGAEGQNARRGSKSSHCHGIPRRPGCRPGKGSNRAADKRRHEVRRKRQNEGLPRRDRRAARLC